MTVNEVDQALRNLIVSQPMISTGPLGGAISGIMQIIDSFRNYLMSVQNYSVQDPFKFNTLTDSQRFENNLCMSICQTLQEKGINIMLYLPAGAMNTPQSPYISNTPTQSLLGQLIFNQPMQQRFGSPQGRSAGQFQPQFGANARPNGQFQPYTGVNQPMGHMPGMGQPQVGQVPGMNMQQPQPVRPMGQMPPMQGNGYSHQFNQYPQQSQPAIGNGMNPFQAGVISQSGAQKTNVYPRTPAPANPIAVGTDDGFMQSKQNPVAEPVIPKPTVQPSKQAMQVKSEPQQKVVKTKTQKSKQVEQPEYQEEEDNTPPSNSSGRDYLLQLLKK